ncbi:MAG: zinc metallopeptidase, partial [Lentisphaeria bacterium]|nr:zinc metallopeptidase [Lentisphaeria bacterium]
FLLSLFASLYTKSTFAKYARVPSRQGFTGAQAAAEMLRTQNVQGVRIERTGGFLSDHYDPRSRTLRLSPDVYQGTSLAAIGVACHEAGHAIQHARNYGPLALRSTLVPVASFGSSFSYILIFLGFLLGSMQLFMVGIACFSLAVIFTIVTLPVEWNASARAKEAMVAGGIVSAQEREGAGAVLNAAFLTYVAAAVSAVLTLLYYLARAGLLGGRRD